MSRRLVLPVIAAAGGAVLVLMLYSLLGPLSGGSGTPARQPDSTGSGTASGVTTIARRAELDLDVYLDLWERSRLGVYVASGRERRWSEEDGEESVLGDVGYHHARDGDHALVVVGSTALFTEDGVTRTCEQMDQGQGVPPQLFCDQGSPAVSAAAERRSLEAELVGRYRLFEGTEPGCVELVGQGPVLFGRIGQSMVSCFDPATGALVREASYSGARRRVLTVSSVEPVPDVADFDPASVVPAVAATTQRGG